MQIMAPPFFAYIVLFLSIFQATAFARDIFSIRNHLQLAPRATTTVNCLQYATVANLSTIGTNSTFRAAFIQASPFGTDKSTGILDGATKTLKNYINNEELNNNCGNLTAVAIQQAPLNFTQGIVGPFKIKLANEGIRNQMGLTTVVLLAIAVSGAAALL